MQTFKLSRRIFRKGVTCQSCSWKDRSMTEQRDWSQAHPLRRGYFLKLVSSSLPKTICFSKPFSLTCHLTFQDKLMKFYCKSRKMFLHHPHKKTLSKETSVWFPRCGNSTLLTNIAGSKPRPRGSSTSLKHNTSQ